MADDETSTSRYDQVWNRVKFYIPFLRDLIKFHQNESQQNRKQQLQKITTMYDLLTNQRLNLNSLCKCEAVLVKLYETNPMKNKKVLQSPETETDTNSRQYDETETPASPPPEEEPEPDPDQNIADVIRSKMQITSESPEPGEIPDSIKEVTSKPPLSLDEIKRLITDKTQEETAVEADSNSNLSKAINDTLKVLSKDFIKPPSKDNAKDRSSFSSSHSGRSPQTSNFAENRKQHDPSSSNNTPKVWDDDKPNQTPKVWDAAPWDCPSSTRTPKAWDDDKPDRTPRAWDDDRPNRTPRAWDDDLWDGPASSHTPKTWENEKPNQTPRVWDDDPWDDSPNWNDDSSFPHPAESQHTSRMGRSYNKPEISSRPSMSPPLYRRRDDLAGSEVRRYNDRVVSPPDHRGSATPGGPPTHIKDPRIRKAINMGVNSPTCETQDPFFPPPAPFRGQNRPPHLPLSSSPITDELLKSLVPGVNQPLEPTRKDPPPRRLSICTNQVIIEEIPPEPVLPRPFPNRRQSICNDYPTNSFEEPSHRGTQFLSPPTPPTPPLFPPQAVPMHMHPTQMQPQFVPPPHHPVHSFAAPHNVDMPTVMDRDPRRRNLLPTVDYPQPFHSQHVPPRHFEHPIHHPKPVPQKAPLTYLEYRRQKEMREKEQSKMKNSAITARPSKSTKEATESENKNKEHDKNSKESDNKGREPDNNKGSLDISIGMIPNKTRVAAKAYAKPSSKPSPKERVFVASSSKDKPRSDSKSHSKHSSSFSYSKKNHDSVKKSVSNKPKDLFGEQLSQFDKMYRSGDFSKKGAPASIGSFKIPKIKRDEKADPSKTHQTGTDTPNKSMESKNDAVDDEEMWDTDSSKPSNSSQKRSKLNSSDAGKSFNSDEDMWDADNEEPSADVSQKTKSKVLSEGTKALEQDDLWDEEFFVEPEKLQSKETCVSEKDKTESMESEQLIGSKEEFQTTTNKEKKVEEISKPCFLMPTKPAPRKIRQRRNSVAVDSCQVAESIKVATLPPSPLPTRRITRRRSSIAGTHLEEPIEKLLDKRDGSVTDTNEDIIRPRRSRKRFAITDDDAEIDTERKKLALSPTIKTKEAEQITPITSPSENRLKAKNTNGSTHTLITKEEDNTENVVSSTTASCEDKKSKNTRKRAVKGKKGAKAPKGQKRLQKSKKAAAIDNNTAVCISNSANEASGQIIKQENNTAAEDDMIADSDKKLVEDALQGSPTSGNKDQLLAMLSKILDEKKLKKIQEIIESPSDKSVAVDQEQQSAGSSLAGSARETNAERQRSTSLSITSSNDTVDKKKKKSELDKLNDDIAEMYIRDGVLSATGRRSCTKKPPPPPPTPKKISPTKKPKAKGKVKRPKIIVANVPEKSLVKPVENVVAPNPFGLKPLKVVVIKLDLKDLESQGILTNAAFNQQTISPRSKKRKRTWAAGTVPKKKKKLDASNKQMPVSPVKVYAPKPVVKNTNRELNCKNDSAKDCALCSFSGSLSSIVQHYVRNHPLHEVYVSRIPNAMANKIKKTPIDVTGVMSSQNICFQCIFCQTTLSKKKYNWKLHLASHTGEYRYKCNNCTVKSLTPCTYSHDSDCAGPAMEVINELFFEDNHAYGYLCKLCNYVQLSHQNMINHVKGEHERQFPAKAIMRFSILNYKPEDDAEQSKDSDISMPELTPQSSCGQGNMSAFVPSLDNVDSVLLSVLNDKSFVSPSKPSIIDKLKQNFDEIMNKDATPERSDISASKEADDEWEDIDSPTKVATRKLDKAQKNLLKATSIKEDVPMPAPLTVKEEKPDLFEKKMVVANMAYNTLNGDTWYLCVIGQCRYATILRSEMYEHVRDEHSSVVWDGFCYLCTAQVVDDESSHLAKEVKHMAVIHIKDRSAVDELIDISSSSILASADDQHALKIRKFSGDKLSLGTPLPPNEPINLKPWLGIPTTKNRAHCLNMLEHRSLYCFYKCMATSCCFTTTLDTMMEKHLENHELVGEVQGSPSTKSWLECAYCEKVCECKSELLDHLQKIHSSSAHQCSYCFYRSRDAYNIILHQRLHHPNNKNEILLIETDKQPMTTADLEFLNRQRNENILPLICTACEAKFCVLDAYMSHLKDVHTGAATIACQCCNQSIQKLKMPRHLLVHKIGIYECIYCQFGSNTMDAIQYHVCDRHPMEPLYCCVRFNKTPGKVMEASLKPLYETTIDEAVFKYCPFKLTELNSKTPDTKSNHEINVAATPTVIPLQLPPIRVGDTSILLSAQIPSSADSPKESVVVSTTVAEVVRMPTIASVSGGVEISTSSSVPIITAVQGNYHVPTIEPSTSVPIISQVTGGISAQTSSSNMPIITRVEGGVGPVASLKPSSSLVGTKIIISPNKVGTGVPIITNVCSMNTSTQQPRVTLEDEATMLEAERVAMEMIKDTGLPKNVIYKCVFKGCNSVLADGTGMRKHLTFTHLPSSQYICVHCKGKPSFANVMLFTQHLKTHETQRIFCFICDYKGSFPPEVIKHVKEVHKTNKPTILFLNPKKNDPNNDIILFAPGQPTEAERKAFYRKLIDLYNHKLQAVLVEQKTHFAPEECEMLPIHAIFSQVIYCSKCQYGTKVRLNMYRHLKGHLNALPVANMDPKNPVPCWNQGEKHFDRMRNPAASSQEDDDLIQSLCFVQENKRYICGAPDCSYLTINEMMLRNHLSTLHSDVKDYKCPHCPAVHVFSKKLNVAKVLEHLKLHDKELYRCSKCFIFSNSKPELDQHIVQKHSTVADVSVFIIRDGSTAGTTCSSEVVFKWKCDVCKFKSVSLTEMRTHMHDTHGMTAKYRCSRCLYGCSNKSLFAGHFEMQHPGCEIVIISMYKSIDGDDSRADTTPLWRREPKRTKSIRGILIEDEDEDDSDFEQISEASQTTRNDIIPATPLQEPVPSGSVVKATHSENIEFVDVQPKSNDETIIKAFKCGFKGCTYVNDFGAGIVAHFRKDHPNDKPSVLRNALANPEQSRFDYFLKYACFYCCKKADTIKELVQHWKQIHQIVGLRSQDKPFLFRTSKIILCFYCRKGAVMPEMKSHFTSCHPGQQPIYLDFRNPKRCAECDFTMGNSRSEMEVHFAQVHQQENEYAKGWVEYLTDEVVDKILKLNSLTYRCEKCDFTSDDKSCFTGHYLQNHPGQAVIFNEYAIDKKIKYYCSFNNYNKREFTSVNELAKYMSQSVPLFKCLGDTRQCTTQFRSFTMLVQHFKASHLHSEVLQYALKTPEEYQQVLRLVTIQFWNGFVMSLEDARLAGNRYGIAIFKQIDELCAESVSTGTQLF